MPFSIFCFGYISLILHPIPIQPCPCYDDVVCFVGAFTGVAMGNWRTNNFYYIDMNRLDKVFTAISNVVEPALKYKLKVAWEHTVMRHVSAKVFASLLFAWVPLVLWKILATPMIKDSVPAIYFKLKHLFVCSRKGPDAEATALSSQISTKALEKDFSQLRQRKSTGAVSNEFAQTTPRMSPKATNHLEEQFCRGPLL